MDQERHILYSPKLALPIKKSNASYYTIDGPKDKKLYRIDAPARKKRIFTKNHTSIKISSREKTTFPS